MKVPWVVRCRPGLAKIVIKELRFRRLLDPQTRITTLYQRNYDLLFINKTSREPTADDLRTAEEIHRCLIYGRYKVSKAQLNRLAASLRALQRPLRLVVTVDGTHFKKPKFKSWLAEELKQRGVLLDIDAEEALWVFCIEEVYYICLRQYRSLDASFRDARVVERPGSLPPTIAAAMAFLSKPGKEEVILDPMCGSGTLLAEAYAYTPQSRFIGFDIDPHAIAAARLNLTHIPQIRLEIQDGTKTDLPANSITLILSNLPFGKQYGDRQHNVELYRNLFTEMIRIGVPRVWRAIFLTGDIASLELALSGVSYLSVMQKVPIRVRGEKATIFVIQPV